MLTAMLAALLGGGCLAPFKPMSAGEVAPGMFVGFKPTREADYAALRASGIRTILNLEQLPWDRWPEARKAKRHGFIYRSVPIMASPLQPPERRVRQALEIMGDPGLRPIYVHCLLGEDRTAFVLGLYAVYYQGWSPEAAWAKMLRVGFHVRWTLRGFDTYFWTHTQRPTWVHTSEEKPP